MNKEYLFEMHAHSSEVSACAKVPVEEIADVYPKAGYDGIILTNHVNGSTFRHVGLEDAPWSEKAEFFLSAYYRLKKLCEGKMTVLLGAEISFKGSWNDYLVYGITEDFIRNMGDVRKMSYEDFSKIAHENGFLFLQAHPFRVDMMISDPDYLDGYEIFNGNPRHNSSNHIAKRWAEDHGKTIVTSGSDFHEHGDSITGGIYFANPINNNDDLLRELRAGNYRLKTGKDT